MSASCLPRVLGIDHIHVYVSDRLRSEAWYREVLGYQRVHEFESWATSSGPLTMKNPEDNVHLAFFERENQAPSNVIAFGCVGSEFLRWREHFRVTDTAVQIKDHDLSLSMYFEDPDQNILEITTYDHRDVRRDLGL